jgi:DNA-binding response OmpR family regulator
MGKARILAVDDQRYFRELIEGLLDDEGYEVQTASSGEEALHILEREDFDVVVTDLVMPGIDGGELIRKIKERLPHQEVVMVTGVVDVKTAVDAMKLGATDYILKPFDRSALADSIDKILKRRRLHDERTRLMEENLEFMSALSLFERAAGLFSTLAIEPLAERLVEGLCLETRAESGVVWAAEEQDESELRMVGVRGLVRVEEESERIRLEELEGVTPEQLTAGRPVVLRTGEPDQERETMLVPIRTGREIVGLVRLADKLGGESFSDGDRAAAEKFCDFGAIAIRNAMRFRSLERRSLRDPVTRSATRSRRGTVSPTVFRS